MESIDFAVIILAVIISNILGIIPAAIVRYLILKRPISRAWAISFYVAFIFLANVYLNFTGQKGRGWVATVGFLSYFILRYGSKKYQNDRTLKERLLGNDNPAKVGIFVLSCVIIFFSIYVWSRISETQNIRKANIVDAEYSGIGQQGTIINQNFESSQQKYGDKLLKYYSKKGNLLIDEYKDPSRLAELAYSKASDRDTMDYEAWKEFHEVDKFIREASAILARNNLQQSQAMIETLKQQWLNAQDRFYKENPSFIEDRVNKIFVKEVNYIISTPQAEKMSNEQVLNLAKVNVENRKENTLAFQPEDLRPRQWIAAQNNFFEQNPGYSTGDLFHRYRDEVNKIIADPEFNSLTDDEVLLLAKTRVDEESVASTNLPPAPVQNDPNINCGDGFVLTPEGSCKPL